MMYFVIYDISDSRLRTKLSKLLIRSGLERIQRSVFSGDSDVIRPAELWRLIERACGQGPELMGHILLVETSRSAFLRMPQMGSIQLDSDYLAGEADVVFPDD